MWSDREGYQDELDDVCPHCGDSGELLFWRFAQAFPEEAVDDLIEKLGYSPKPYDMVPCWDCEELSA